MVITLGVCRSSIFLAATRQSVDLRCSVESNQIKSSQNVIWLRGIYGFDKTRERISKAMWVTSSLLVYRLILQLPLFVSSLSVSRGWDSFEIQHVTFRLIGWSTSVTDIRLLAFLWCNHHSLPVVVQHRLSQAGSSGSDSLLLTD